MVGAGSFALTASFATAASLAIGAGFFVGTGTAAGAVFAAFLEGFGFDAVSGGTVDCVAPGTVCGAVLTNGGYAFALAGPEFGKGPFSP